MTRSKTGWILGLGIVAAIALAAVVAISTTSDDSSAVPDNVEQTRTITVDGTPLPPLPDGPPDAIDDPAIGMTAPILTGQSFDGSAVSTAGDAARLLLFVAHWCSHCQREVPLLVDWAEGGGVPDGVEVRVISTAVDPNAPNYPPSAWLADERVTWPVLADGPNRTGAAAMGLSGFPYFVLLRADNTVAWRGSGEMDPAVLGERITTLLNS